MFKIGQMNKITNAKYSLIISTHHSPALRSANSLTWLFDCCFNFISFNNFASLTETLSRKMPWNSRANGLSLVCAFQLSAPKTKQNEKQNIWQIGKYFVVFGKDLLKKYLLNKFTYI